MFLNSLYDGSIFTSLRLCCNVLLECKPITICTGHAHIVVFCVKSQRQWKPLNVKVCIIKCSLRVPSHIWPFYLRNSYFLRDKCQYSNNCIRVCTIMSVFGLHYSVHGEWHTFKRLTKVRNFIKYVVPIIVIFLWFHFNCEQFLGRSF